MNIFIFSLFLCYFGISVKPHNFSYFMRHIKQDMDFLQNKFATVPDDLNHRRFEMEQSSISSSVQYDPNYGYIINKPKKCFDYVCNFLYKKCDCEMSMIEKIIWLN